MMTRTDGRAVGGIVLIGIQTKNYKLFCLFFFVLVVYYSSIITACYYSLFFVLLSQPVVFALIFTGDDGYKYTYKCNR